MLSKVASVNNPQGGTDSLEHIKQAAGLLRDFINSMNKSWPPELQYKGTSCVVHDDFHSIISRPSLSN